MRQIIVDFGTLHLFGADMPIRIFGYGLMMVLGFLCAIALAQWRARRAGEHSDHISYCGLLALIGGVAGARAAYVIENPSQFRTFGDVMNITSGGLIYYGGLAAATAAVLGYLFLRKLPVRRFLDIVAPSLMIGLAFGHAGCLLNGCCYGGPCRADWALATRFPMISKPLVHFGPGVYAEGQSLCPAYADQYAEGMVTPDPRLLSRPLGARNELIRPAPLPVGALHGALAKDQLPTMLAGKAEAEKLFMELADPDEQLSRTDWLKGIDRRTGFLRGSEQWVRAVAYDADRNGALSFEEAWLFLEDRLRMLEDRFAGGGELTGAAREAANRYLQADLYLLLEDEHTLAMKPAQALGIVNAILLGVLLMAFGRLRRREGQVFALLMVLYPITRFLLESIRSDNPHDLGKGILTHNQYTSIAVVIAGIVFWIALRKLQPSAGPVLADRMAAGQAKASSRAQSKRKTERK